MKASILLGKDTGTHCPALKDLDGATIAKGNLQLKLMLKMNNSQDTLRLFRPTRSPGASLGDVERIKLLKQLQGSSAKRLKMLQKYSFIDKFEIENERAFLILTKAELKRLEHEFIINEFDL